MSRVVDQRIADLLHRAAEERSCYVALGDDAARVRRALSRRAACGSVVSPGRGMFADARTWEALKPGERSLWAARGLQALHPDWVFCGPTAALAYGIDVSDDLVQRIHVATAPGRCGSSPRTIARHPVLGCPPFDEVVGLDGLRVTGPAQTVFDCLRWTDFPRGLGIVDSALREGVVGAGELAALAVSVSTRRRNVGRVLAALDWADPRSENGGESIARGRMLLLGFVRPELQVEVPRVVEEGRPYRADYCWIRADGLVILGELDGTIKYLEEEFMGGRDIGEVLSDENVRGSRFTLYDVSLVRFGFGVTDSPVQFERILDDYGVPRRGTPLALPDGTPMIPDWESLRRNRR